MWPYLRFLWGEGGGGVAGSGIWWGQTPQLRQSVPCTMESKSGLHFPAVCPSPISWGLDSTRASLWPRLCSWPLWTECLWRLSRIRSSRFVDEMPLLAPSGHDPSTLTRMLHIRGWSSWDENEDIQDPDHGFSALPWWGKQQTSATQLISTHIVTYAYSELCMFFMYVRTYTDIYGYIRAVQVNLLTHVITHIKLKC